MSLGEIEMSVSLMQRRTFGPDVVLDKYGLGPIEVGSGAQSHDVQAVTNLNRLDWELKTTRRWRQMDQENTLARVRAEHVKLVNDAAAAVAAREEKPASLVTQAEIDAQLEGVLPPTHPLIRATRISAAMANEYQDLAARIAAASTQMKADGLIK
jgi:hypothetical protein